MSSTDPELDARETEPRDLQTRPMATFAVVKPREPIFRDG